MKKLISMALSVVLALSLMPSTFAAERASEFTDVPEGAWYAEELDYAVYNGYISGTSDTTFSPESTVTRGQFVTIMGRMLNAPTDGGKTAFEDVPENAFYAPYVAWASSKGYVNGFSVKEFGPNNNISVEQMAAILDNYIRKEGAVLTEAPVVYTDMASVSRWAVSAVEAMARYNLLHVDASGNVNPQKQVSRAEAAVALVRLAKSLSIGVVPPAEPTSGVTDSTVSQFDLEAAAVAKRVHDELWASGQLTSSMTAKEKAIVYYLWMCQNCKYKSKEAATNVFGQPGWVVDEAYGPLVLGFGECDGLTHAYNMLLGTEGIECKLLCSSSHAWTGATLDGKEYEIDITGGVCMAWDYDGSYKAESAMCMCDKSFMDYDEWHDKWYGDYTPLEW